MTQGCLPSVIRFTDASTTTSGGIVSWRWNFGDGTTSTDRNPTHTYTANGFYNVSLHVKNAAGCEVGTTKFRYIRIVSGVKADFTTLPPPTCSPPFAVQFKNETSGPGVLTYDWNLGNNTTSGNSNPAGLYNSSGNYPIRLIVTSNFGCADTINKNITVSGFATGFNAPDTVCINSEIDFQNTASQVPKKVLWDFGDGSSSKEVNPSYTFTAPGNYSVKLINEYDDCKDSVIKNITVVSKPTISFTAAKTTACKAPFTVNFQDQTPNSVSWKWEFGNGQQSTVKNPNFTYNNEGEYNVTLTAKDAYGCENTLTQQNFVQIIPPSVEIDQNKGGCIPYFYVDVPNATSIDGIASYLWDFGDGTTQAGQFASHNYPNVGQYAVKLQITTNEGCVKTATALVKTGTPVTPAFSLAPPVSCAFDTVRFTNLTPSANSYTYQWDFGDFNLSRDINPTYSYSDTGTFNVTLTAINNGCGTISPSKSVTINPPVSDFDFNVNCATGRTVSFVNLSKTNASLGTITYLWDFGDGTSTDNSPSPTHTFSQLGTFTVSLTVTNGNCDHTIKKTIKLTQEIADFSISKSSPVCRNETIIISAINSNPQNIQSYTWQIGDQTVFGPQTFTYNFPDNKTYDIGLTIVDSNGCVDTKFLPGFVNVSGPNASFTAPTTATCASKQITFTDISNSVNKIVKWEWEFGDGKKQTFTKAPFTHTYTDTGVFNVNMKITDDKGCVDSLQLVSAVTITNPKALFSADTTMVCPGVPITLKDSSEGKDLIYRWNISDGSSYSDKNPIHSFSGSDNQYSVKLWIRDLVGCEDSITKNNFITIKNPKPAFTAVDTTSICPPLETKFFFSGKDYESFYWDFGDSSDISTLENPTHFYNAYGNYTAKLFLTGYGGCLDSAVHQVVIYDPNQSTFTYNPLNACNELTVNFDIKPSPHTRFILDFGDGQADSSQTLAPSHFYASPAFYYPTLSMIDNVGCQVVLSSPIDIKVIGAQPLFGIDKSEFCDTGLVYFTDYTIGNDPVVSMNWNFGDGSTSTDKNPTHKFSIPGEHIVRLTVNTEAGCTDDITDTIRIYQTPEVTVNIPDTICFNAPVQFKSVAAGIDSLIAYNWTFGDGQASTNKDPLMKFTKLGDIPVTLKTSIPFGCQDSLSTLVHVVPLPTVTAVSNPTIIAGGSTPLPVTYSGNIINYNWTPSNSLSCADCPAPVAKPTKTTTYKIIVTDNYGCSNGADITVFVICGEKNVFVPNTFSPNNDGVNDRFYPRGEGLYRIQSMRVFNRWGETVFQKINFNANDASSGWDGTFKGKKADPDVYVYIVEVLCDNGEVFPMKGNIMLMK